jgi:ATP-dependent DNA helicase RecG
VVRIDEAGIGRNKRLNAIFSDTTGSIELVWFKGITWMAKWLKPNVNYWFLGKQVGLVVGLALHIPRWKSIVLGRKS